MTHLDRILYLLALICFVLAAFVAAPVDLVAIGLAFFAAGHLL